MRKILLASSALCALATGIATPAAAADIRLPAYRPVAVCATCNWTGFYVGGTIGESKDVSSSTDSLAFTENFPTGSVIGVGGGPLVTTTGPLSFTQPFQNTYHHSSAGVIGGLEAGYNWQMGGLVLGVEGDYSWSNERSSETYTSGSLPGVFPPVPNFFFLNNTAQGWTSEERIDWLTTLRARLGWAHDCYLWYVTGGVAWAKIESNHTVFSTPGNPGLAAAAGGVGAGTFASFGLPGGGMAGSFSTTKTGWVLGGGVETNMSWLLGLAGNNWTMKLEYLYVDLGSVNNAIGTNLTPVIGTTVAPAALVTGTAAFSSQNRIYEQIVRIGVNYKFNTYAAAAITK